MERTPAGKIFQARLILRQVLEGARDYTILSETITPEQEESFCAQDEESQLRPIYASRRGSEHGGGCGGGLIVMFIKGQVTHALLRGFGASALQEGFDHLILVFVNTIHSAGKRLVTDARTDPGVLKKGLRRFEAFNLIELGHNRIRRGVDMPEELIILGAERVAEVSRKFGYDKLPTYLATDIVPRILGCPVGGIIYACHRGRDGTRESYRVVRMPALPK